MESHKTISRTCLSIKPDDTITSAILTFDSYFSNKNSPSNFEIVNDNIKNKYDCRYYYHNLIPAPFPDHTYYSLFYQSEQETGDIKYNKIASQILGKKCYGECLIVHFDTFNDLCDIDCDTFVKLYNSHYPQKMIYPKPIKNIYTSKNNCVCIIN